MTDSNFQVKNTLIANGVFIANSTIIAGNTFTANNIGITGNTFTANNLSITGNNFVVNSSGLTTSNVTATNLTGTIQTVSQPNITSNNSTYLGGIVSTSYVNSSQLSSNLTNYQTTTGFNGNVAAFLPTYTGVVNASSLTGTSFSVNSSLVNAVSINVTNQINTTTLYAATSANVASVTTANSSGIYTTGVLSVSNSATITGALTVTGNLNIAGATTFVNTTVITTTDKNIILSNGAVSSALTSGTGIVAATYANLVYNDTTTSWQSNVGLTPSSNNLSLGGLNNVWNLYANQIYGTIATISQPNITANNTNFVGTISAANVVSNAQLSSNLTNYAALSGATFTGQVSATTILIGGVNVNTAITSNAAAAYSNAVANAAALYQTTAGLSANVATLTSNNTSFVGTISAANVVSNAQLSSNLTNYAALSGATFTGTIVIGGSTTSYNGVYGISNTSPGVYGISNTSRGVIGISNTDIGVYGISNTNAGVYGLSNTSAGVYGVSNTSRGVLGISNTDVGVYGISTSGLPAYFGNNTTEFFRVANNGNVGVGEASPSQKLEVNGNILAGSSSGVLPQGQFNAVFGSGSTWYNAMLRNDGGSAYLLSSSAQTTRAGAVAAPFNNYRPIRWDLSTGAVWIDGTAAGTWFGGTVNFTKSIASTYYFNEPANDTGFTSGGDGIINVNLNNGYVGQWSPNGGFGGGASFSINDTITQYREISGSNSDLWYNDGSKISMRVNGGAYYGFDGASNFWIAGSIVASSDITLKTNITVIPDSLPKIARLRGVTFDWIASGEVCAGVIAQDVQAVLPEIVRPNMGPDGHETLSVNYNGLIGLLIEGTKELIQQNKDLAARIAILESKVK